MINNVVLVGRMTRDVDLRYTANGTAAGNFTIAVDRPFKNQQGERETDFIMCQIWRKSAENFANFTRKGSLVGVQGRIQTRNYEDRDGKKVYVTEIVVENFALLDSKNSQNNSPQGGSSNQQGNPRENRQSPPQANYGRGNDPFSDNGQVLDLSDDELDLPF